MSPDMRPDVSGAPAPAAPRRAGVIRSAMSVDVEDYFQVQALANTVSRSDWESLPSRVERNTNEVLDLFAAHGVKATFFTLGWVAERHPALVRRIVADGHELASHGWSHVRADDQAPEAFRADVRRTKAQLEDCGGVAIQGYRAASFSIGKRNTWAFAILAEEGHSYSSSVNPIHHDLYGMPDAPRFPFRPIAGERFREFPITSVNLFGHNLPCGGGGFFRLLPYAVTTTGMKAVLRRDHKPCVFYFHPWEIDPGQPVQHGLSFKSRFRHYTNLSRMKDKLARLLDEFAWDRVDAVLEAELPG